MKGQYQFVNLNVIVVKVIIQKWKFCHHLLILMQFQPWTTYFLLWRSFFFLTNYLFSQI